MSAVNVEFIAGSRMEGAEVRRRKRIEAFHPAYRRFIRDLTNCSPPLEDLADSFPALLFALSTGYGTPPKRQRSFELVCNGSTLREAADAVGLPLWLRKLPPQAFTEPLPSFPEAPEYALRMSNLIPRDPHLTPDWLKRVGYAQEAAGRDYALWIARQPDLGSWPDELFAFMAAWAWYSQHTGLLGHRLLRRPWTPEMSFKRAREELGAWRQRVRLIEYLGPGIETPWLIDGTAGGFDFVALRTVDDFIGESDVLDNCLDQYADQLHSGRTAVFSIRKGPRHVACVEIGPHDEEVSMPTIVQLRGARNRRVTPEIWQAAFAWLGGQRLEPLSPERHAPKPTKRTEIRRQLWAPYLTFLETSGRAQHFRRAVLERSRMRFSRGSRRRTLADTRQVFRTVRRQNSANE